MGKEKFEVPEGWKEELGRRRIMVVSPRTVGNSRAVAWRLTGAVVAARRAMQELEVDEGHLCVPGLSGGGRKAGIVGLVLPELFCGSIPICGISYFRNMPVGPGSAKYHQGFFPGLERGLVERAKRNISVLVSGTADFYLTATRRTHEVIAAEGFAGVRFEVVDWLEHALPVRQGFVLAPTALDEPAMNEAAILAGRARQAKEQGRVGEAQKLARVAWGRDSGLKAERERVKRRGEPREKERKDAQGRPGERRKWETRWGERGRLGAARVRPEPSPGWVQPTSRGGSGGSFRASAGLALDEPG